MSSSFSDLFFETVTLYRIYFCIKLAIPTRQCRYMHMYGKEETFLQLLAELLRECLFSIRGRDHGCKISSSISKFNCRSLVSSEKMFSWNARCTQDAVAPISSRHRFRRRIF